MSKYDALDVPKQNRSQFAFHLTQDRQSFFLELVDENQVSVGLVYFTQVLPLLSATFNVVTWDGKLSKDRCAAMREGLRLCMTRFQLQRIGAQIKWSNRVIRDVLKRIGMTWEGTVRKGWVDVKGCEDALLFGVIREEL